MALLLGSVNVAFAEESGGFVGFGIGGGGIQLHQKGFDVYGDSFNDTTNLSGINYGFVAGYKQFFTPYLGLRYYVNLDLHHNLKKVDNVEQTFRDDVLINEEYLGKTRYDITLINYGVNVDFLGNFLVTEMVDFGGFIGLGIGANSVTGKFIKEIKDAFVADGMKFSDTGFDIALNLGLRTNIAKYHGIEISARVPFMPVKMVNTSGVNDLGSYEYKYTLKQTYNILARYTFMQDRNAGRLCDVYFASSEIIKGNKKTGKDILFKTGDNVGAVGFYEKIGLKIQKIGMEKIL